MKISAGNAKRQLGRRIADLRSTCGITQEELSQESEVDVRYLQRIEAGEKNVTIETLVRIANVLRVQIVDLFTKLDRSAAEAVEPVSQTRIGRSRRKSRR